MLEYLVHLCLKRAHLGADLLFDFLHFLSVLVYLLMKALVLLLEILLDSKNETLPFARVILLQGGED